MFSINNKDLKTIQNKEFLNNNYIFSSQVSRPSKSLIDCEAYKKYSKINLNLEILDEFSYINSQTKSKEYYLIREIINVFKLDNLDIDNFSLSFDSIIINEFISKNKNENENGNDNKNEKEQEPEQEPEQEKLNNLLLCFDVDISLNNIINNIYLLIKELQRGDSLILNFTSLFTYPSAELLIIICNMFSKVKVYYCKLIKQNVLYCNNYASVPDIHVFIKNIKMDLNKNSNIRQFGLFIDELILKKIKNHNNFIFNYYIELNDNFINCDIEEKEYFFKNYLKKHNKLNCSTLNCNHNLKVFNMFNCYICNKCFDLFSVYV